ncbi:MAG: tRNA (adenosine(37)-N6)-dimethylallyltransferase MiaA [Bacillota bacterium]|jgi:tRNA dimethylallyltransferase
MKQKVIAIVGPTAAGKSALAVEVAKGLNGEIISADSAQVYRGMNIGTAKITSAETQGIRHHLIDIVGPETDYNIGRFQMDAGRAIRDIADRGKCPILCGGSGLYLYSVINSGYQLENTPLSSPEKREELKRIAEERGEGYLYECLKEKFPLRAGKIHPHDTQRVLRALEMNEDLSGEEENRWDSPYQLSIYGLSMERSLLYQRIEERVERMFEEGLPEEVANLLAMGYRRDGNAMAALGYKELIPVLEHQCSIDDAKELLKKNTRHFAKRQITWFKRDPRIHWFDVSDAAQRKVIAETIIALEKNEFT